jgi:hypothetical protein
MGRRMLIIQISWVKMVEKRYASQSNFLGVNAGFERQPLIVQISLSWSWFYAINAQSSNFGEGAGAVASGANNSNFFGSAE